MACSTSVEAEDELVEIAFQISSTQTVIGARRHRGLAKAAGEFDGMRLIARYPAADVAAARTIPIGPAHRSQPCGAGGFVMEHALKCNQAIGKAAHGVAPGHETNPEQIILSPRVTQFLVTPEPRA